MMPNVTVTADTFRAGAFPPVCALTGAPATTTHRVVVVRRGAFADRTGRRRRMLGRGGLARVEGRIPLSDAAARRTRAIERARAVLAAVAVAGFVAGVFTSLALLLGSTALAVLLGLSLYLTVGAEIDRRGESVVLLHVHPSFAAAASGFREVAS